MIFAYITDLFFQVKVSQTAKNLGVDLKIFSSDAQLLVELNSTPSLVLVDLSAIGALTLISEIKRNEPAVRVVAYSSHVQTELMDRAKEAGADDVMPRSQFSRILPELLTATR